MKLHRNASNVVPTMLAIIIILFAQNPFHQLKLNTANAAISTLQGSKDETVSPLPRGCGGVTPPGENAPTCCVNGYVYLEGQPVAGAEVTITSPRGDTYSLFTSRSSIIDDDPFYELSLSSPPLSIQSGETITITARFEGRETSITYTVQPGSQQVDIVLPRNQTGEFTPVQTISLIDRPGTFDSPTGIAVDSDGRVYVADSRHHRIQVFDSNGTFLSQWGTYGQLESQFNNPNRIVIDSIQNIYILDSGNRRVQKFDRQARLINSWSTCNNFTQCPLPNDIAIDNNNNIAIAYQGGVTIFSATGTVQQTWINDLDGQRIEFDPIGNIYITEGQNKIYKFSSNGTLLKVIESNLDHIQSITIDSSGSFLVTDPIMGIVRLSEAGSIEQQWSIPNEVFTDITISSNNNIYLTSNTNRVVVFNPNEGIIRSWGEPSMYRDVVGIVALPDQSVLVANREPATIVKIDSQRRVTTITLNPRPQRIVDIALAPDQLIYILDQVNITTARIYKIGVNGNQLFSFATSNVFASSITVSASGNIFITDLMRDRILTFFSNGQFSSSWGTSGSEQGDLSLPIDLATDNSGYVYVADFGNRRIQKFTESGDFVSAFFALMDGWSNQVIHVHNNTIYTYNNLDLRLHSPDHSTLTVRLVERVSGWSVSYEGYIYTFHPKTKLLKVFHPMRYTRPIATINYLNLSSLEEDDILVMHGMGQDSDETNVITAWRWTSNKNGVIGTSRILEIPASTLNSGHHIITLEVQDNEGEWSQPITVVVYIATNSQTASAWAALLYLNADYRTDGNSLLLSFNRALQVLQTTLSNPAIRVAAQVDGPNDGDSYRLLIEPGTPPQVMRISLPEQSMDDPQTLIQFLRWGQSTLLAQHYYLAISNHGQGVQGISWDSTSDRVDDGRYNNSAYLTIRELREALNTTDIKPISIIHLDACSMGLIEVAYELRPRDEVPPRSRLLITSQYAGWSFFSYEEYFANIHTNSTPLSVAQTITNIYANRASRIGLPFTITTLDLGQVTNIAMLVSNLSSELAAYAANSLVQYEEVRNVRNTSAHLESNGNYINDQDDAYIDLLDWGLRIRSSILDPAIQQRAEALIEELRNPQSMIVHEAHRVGSGRLPSEYGGHYIDLSRINGISVFYPSLNRGSIFNRYISHQLFEFTRHTRWSEFLTSGVLMLDPGSGAEDDLDPLETLSIRYTVQIPLIIK